jgi:hypothetical protein
MLFLIGYHGIAAGICLVLLMVVLRGENIEHSTLYYIAVGLQFVVFALGLAMGGWGLAIIPFACVWALRRICDTSWPRAIVAGVLYAVVQVVVAISFAYIIQYLKEQTGAYS